MIVGWLNDYKSAGYKKGQMCQNIIQRRQTEPDLLRRVVTDDETWIFEYDP